MNDQQFMCAAAILGHTNIGMERPSREKVQGWFARQMPRFPWTLNSYVEACSGHLFENDEMYDTFLGEAESWMKQVDFDDFPWVKELIL